jgi:predicted nicotinamide N-methyase
MDTLPEIDDLVEQTIDLPRGPLRILQPRESAELPDDGPVEWAPIAPYWSVLWRSGVALAREVDGLELRGRRVVELGCGLGLPSLAAARAGAEVLTTDGDAEALPLVACNAERNGVAVETAAIAWDAADELLARASFDLVLAADVLYERQAVAPLLALLPRLTGEALIADPGRSAAEAFEEEARRRWRLEALQHGEVRMLRLTFS